MGHVIVLLELLLFLWSILVLPPLLAVKVLSFMTGFYLIRLHGPKML